MTGCKNKRNKRKILNYFLREFATDKDIENLDSYTIEQIDEKLLKTDYYVYRPCAYVLFLDGEKYLSACKKIDIYRAREKYLNEFREDLKVRVKEVPFDQIAFVHSELDIYLTTTYRAPSPVDYCFFDP